MSRLLPFASMVSSGVARRYHRSVWAGISWLRLACAAGLAIGIAQQLALLALHIHMQRLETSWVRLSAATMLCAGVACWYLANSPRLPFLVVAGLLVVLAGLWWSCTALKDVDVVRLQVRIFQEPPKSRLTLHAGRTDGAGLTICGFLYSALSLPRCRCQRRCSQRLRSLGVAMFAVLRVPLARFSGTTGGAREAAGVPSGADDALKRACHIPYRFVVTLSGENRATLHRRDDRRTRIQAHGREVHHAGDLFADRRPSGDSSDVAQDSPGRALCLQPGQRRFHEGPAYDSRLAAPR